MLRFPTPEKVMVITDCERMEARRREGIPHTAGLLQWFNFSADSAVSAFQDSRAMADVI